MNPATVKNILHHIALARDLGAIGSNLLSLFDYAKTKF